MTHLTRTICLLTAACLVSGTASAKPKPTPKPDIKALLITGGCCHDYTEQREVIPVSIDRRSRQNVEWTILHQRTSNGGYELDFYKNPDWAKGYDVVVHNECFAKIGDPEYLESILVPHRDGVPAVLIHCTMHCYRAGPSKEDKKLAR